RDWSSDVCSSDLYDALNLLKVADIADALCFEAQNGVVDALDHRVHDVRPHSGQLATARNLLKLLEGSKNTTRQGEIRVQDAYSLRCSPQIHGASKDAVNYVLDKVNIEINSVTRSEEHTSELQSRFDLVCRLLLDK